MSRILVAADAVWIRDQVKTAFVAPGQEILEASRGQDVRDIVGAESPDLVILDSQIANMGGVATSIDLRLEAAAGRVPDVRSCSCSTARPTVSSLAAPTPTACS